MGLVKITTDQEKLLLMSLLDEFGPRIIRTRKESKTEGFGHYGISNVEDCPCCVGKIYDIMLPDHYISFFNYLLEERKLRH